ncbi:MAG: helix-turn-helix domain-containing protein [Kangiellaceae bacterium]|nr:helix-turn-helix domain-containing protein [Kangiellaceae bacterium]
MFRIGEFSKFTQVPGSALRYYDDIGLFKPSVIDDATGYRYYSAYQIPQLNKIIALKELGLNLEQIQKLMNDQLGTDEFKGMLALKRAEVNQQIEIESNRLLQIEARLSHIDTDSINNEFAIITKRVPNQQYLAIRESISDFEVAQQIIVSIMKAAAYKINKSDLGRFTAILHSECFDVENIDIEFGIVVNGECPESLTLADGRKLLLKQLEGHKLAVSSTSVGSPSSSFCCRSAIAQWIENNHYEMVGHGREVFIVPPMPGKVEQTVLEFQYPIQPKAS